MQVNIWAEKIQRFRAIEKIANISVSGAQGFNKKDGVAKVTRPRPVSSEPNPPIVTRKQMRQFKSKKSKNRIGSLLDTGLGVNPAKTLAKFPKIKKDRKGNIQKIAHLLRTKYGISSY